MKTPREILLARHRKAEPALDALRAEALKTIAACDNAKQEADCNHRASALWMFFREIFLPARGIWTGLAACWAVILILHFAAQDSSPVVAKTSPPPSPGRIMALRSQEQLLAELLSGDGRPSDAEQPRYSQPSPHSEIRAPYATA